MITDRDEEFHQTINVLAPEELGRTLPIDPVSMEEWTQWCRDGMTGDQLRQVFHDSPEGIAYRARPKVPFLKQVGNDFVDENRNRIVLSGIDGFLDLRLFKDGKLNELDALLKESNDLKYQVRRIWCQGSKKQNQTFDLFPTEPGYDEALIGLVDYENSKGLIPLMTCFIDNQDVQSLISQWNKLDELTHGKALLKSGFNQWSKNCSNFGPYDLSNVSGIWSRGSDVDDTKTNPNGAPSSELHSTRISFERSLMDAIASPINMQQSGATMVWMTEGIPFDINSSTQQAWELGRAYSVKWALAVYHNRQSQRGQLMQDGTRNCAEHWQRGIKL